MSNPEKKSFPDLIQSAIQKAWNDALSTRAGVEEEIKRRLRHLMERTGLQQGSDELQRVFADLGRRLQHNREEIERRLDESVRTAVIKFRDPLIDELASLRKRAEQLGQRIEDQLRRGSKTSSSEDADDPKRDASAR